MATMMRTEPTLALGGIASRQGGKKVASLKANQGNELADKVNRAHGADRARVVCTIATSPPAQVESREVSSAKPASNVAPYVKPGKKPAPVSPSHSITPERLEIVQSLDSWAQEGLLPLMKTVEQSWQPQDYLPAPEAEDFIDQVRELRRRSEGLPDDYLVCLVGDTITEEALPTYQTMLNTLDGTRDVSGADLSPWGIWIRMWTAEENRHGDLLNKYLYLTGRVNMRAVEKTTQYLIGYGMDPKTENNPYLGFVYTSFQERATFVSHGNTARHAKTFGDEKLATVCGLIAADERRHEVAYTKIVEKLFESDPTGAMLAFEDMMRKQVVMPAHMMYDGENENLFDDFAAVAQRTGVYTGIDYADIMAHFVDRWGLEKMEGLDGEGRRAQEFLCKLPDRIRRMAERSMSKAKKEPSRLVKFSWVFNREVLTV